jgi:Zn-dependent protease
MALSHYMNGGPEGWAVLAAIIFLILMTNACHEGGHAFAAWCGGDRRADLRRRCTLNPINHFHWFLTLVLPVGLLLLSQGQFLAGGARPVMIDRGKLGRVRMALAALAGPVGNFLCAGFLMLLLGLAWSQEWFDITQFDQVSSKAYMILKIPIWFCFFLGLLNLAPVPGLDGGHIFAMLFLPDWAQRIWYKLTPLGILIILGTMLWYGGFLRKWGLIETMPTFDVIRWIADRVEAYTLSAREWWDAVL